MPAPPSHRGALGRLLAACAIVFTCCVGGVFAVGVNELHATTSALEVHPRVDLGETATTTTTTGGGPTSGSGKTILLIGSDHRAKTAKDNARSDTMMLVRLSPRAKAVTVLSVPRDLKVTIPGRGVAKLNAAYAYGGVPLTVKTLREVLGIGVDHVIDVDFGGFRALVNALGCVYTDVDRRYFNRNDGTAATNFAAIDIQAGYQRLCGADALDYVRYRHGDNDLVRAARQHDFLRQARAQFGVTDLLGDRHTLIRLLGEHTRTDIRGTKQVTALAKLALGAADKPVQEIPFPAVIGPSYVTATPSAIKATVRRFLHPTVAAQSSSKAKTKTKRKRARTKTRLPTIREQATRRYRIKDASGTSHRATRRSVRIGVGEYYGIQTTDWTDAPILAAPDGQRTLGGRTFDLYYDGRHLRRVALRTAEGSAWVSNTLTLALTNAQMLALARTL
ncbi:LCP family protein [Solirubrobacter phytolaccae]|uniref:LCP family protein n=1 Tax=Solirubrobacter phytolaccae TaxID=1404360 RepID=A0A9X3S7J5_9ACTN|nr:LCP family protein [Solirubrobacter phytolaccae]MDA0180348.1 LCP family protein [Solirubrobacter phytolaccae]